MQIILIGLKCAFILLGFITMLIGKYLSSNYILSRKVKYKISDTRNHIKGCRITLYILRLYYIIWGIILLLIKGWPMISIYFSSLVPAIIVILFSNFWRKYMKLVLQHRYTKFSKR